METMNEKGIMVKNQSWYNPYVYEGEINDEPSQTIPNMSYSVQEILEKHVRGINLPVMQRVTYEEGSIDSPQISKMVDITEVESLKSETVARITAKATTKKTALESEAKSSLSSGTINEA